MNAPFVSAGQALQENLAKAFTPVTVEVPQPNTGFAAIDDPSSVPAPTTAPDPAKAAAAVADYDKRMAKVMGQAQQVQSERSAVAQERAQLKADLAELQQYRDLKARAKEDPVSVAETFGYRPDEYATVLMDKGSLTPERRKALELSKEVQELRSWREQEIQRQHTERQSGLYNSVRGEMVNFGTDSDAYDLVHRTKSYDKVLNVVQQHYQRTFDGKEGEILPYDQAFAQVERELEDYYSPVLESPKLRSKLTPPPAEAQSPADPSFQSAVRKPSGTINSKMRAQSAPPAKLTRQQEFELAGEVMLRQMRGGK